MSDFGSSISLRTVCSAPDTSPRAHSFVGTAEYLAPELLASTPLPLEQFYAADVWALGVMLFQLVYRRLPFHDRTEYLVFQNIQHMRYSFTAPGSSDTDTNGSISGGETTNGSTSTRAAAYSMTPEKLSQAQDMIRMLLVGARARAVRVPRVRLATATIRAQHPV